MILENFTKGCDLRQHYRPFIKDSRVKVSHLHFHLHPRELEDNYYQSVQQFEKNLWQDLSDQEREKFAKLYTS